MIFPELNFIKDLNKHGDPLVTIEPIETISQENNSFPILGVTIGPNDPTLPTFGIFGGVHGLEKVGTHVAISFLNSITQQLQWDRYLRMRLQECRLVSIPLLNPAGMHNRTRCNPSGVDLMRNSPINSPSPSHWLISGHRISPKLPWYRGALGAPMEPESISLINFVKRELLQSSTSIALDLHSGFGMQDRLWHPFAKSKQEFPYLKQVIDLKKSLDQSYPYHVYKVESQSDSYTTHGDLWDYLFEIHETTRTDQFFFPLTLEMGSWNWLRKNLLQIFSSHGFFNPMKVHRYNRIMRRHLALMNFCLNAVSNHKRWCP